MGAYVRGVSEEFEEMERIPWAALAAATPDPRRRLAAVGIGLVALLALVLVAGRWLLAPGASADPDPVEALRESADAVTASTVPAEEIIQARPTPAEPVAPAGAAIYSEADLMAASVDAEVKIAELWAERFVRDYLTVDGDGSVAAAAAQLVATELPAPTAGLASFVEWAEPYAITATRPGQYRVEVAYRLLTGSAGSFVRQPAAAMAVTLEVDVDGTATFAGPPEAITLPTLLPATTPTLTEQIPEWVLENVQASGASIVGAYRRDGVWWVVLTSELAPGIVRPHAVGVAG